MAMISFEFDLPLPNDFLVDHSFSEGKSRPFTYDGPDKLYMYIGEHGTELHGPVTAEDLADGRPCPVDSTIYELDCVKYPVIAQLRGPIINHTQPDLSGAEQVPHPHSPIIPGYPQYKYSLPLMPDDVFNRYSFRLIDGQPTIQAWTATQKLIGRDVPLTWDDVRQHRDRMLSNSDSQIAIDMPQGLKDIWMTYRQKLRDLPSVMQEHSVPPTIAYYMFPFTPDTDPEYADWFPKNTGVGPIIGAAPNTPIGV